MKRILTILLMSSSVAWAEKIPPTPPANFGGGLNVRTISSDIDDNESPDMSNMVNDIYGSSGKRNGSSRYVGQAYSSNPVTALARVYTSSSATYVKSLIAVTSDRIVYSTDDVNPTWLTLSSGLTPNQHWEGAMVNNKFIMTGDALTDNIKSFDVNAASMTNFLSNAYNSSDTVRFRARHLLNSRNYLLAANVADITNGTTYYASRVYYSQVLVPSSNPFTANRYIDYLPNDGEEITYIGEKDKKVQIFKETSIGELDWTVGLNLTDFGGDQTLTTVVKGFGCIAPRSMVNAGLYYIFLAKDGIRIWDGGNKTRLNNDQESRIISVKIEPIINDLIHSGRYRNAIGYYYPKKSWYMFAYEDATASPIGRNNSMLVYDIRTDAWFRFKNLNAECFASFDGAGDVGDLLYGDSNDGYVYYMDRDISANDARKEIVINPMNVASDWNRGIQDVTFVKEGTASIRMTLNTEIKFSSISNLSVINLGDWQDKTKTSRSDKLSFKVYATSVTNLTQFRMDIEINDTKGEFDGNFTSVTFSSSAFTGGNNGWTTFEIPLSSFPLIKEWVDISSEAFPFANTYTYYGIRFFSTGTGGANLYIDDLRFVQATENPLNAYRFTKQFNFGALTPKTFKGVYLNAETGADSSFFIDVYVDFGGLQKRIPVSGDIRKEIFISGYGGTQNMTRLNSVDFSVIDSTIATDRSAFAIGSITADENYVYGADLYNHRIMKVDRSSMGVVVSTYGSLGTGTNNLNIPYEMAVDDKYLYIIEFGNHRLSVRKKSDLSFAYQYGTLGSNTTSFHAPTGVAVDDKYVYIGNDGNHDILKFDKASTTGSFVAVADLNLNTIGDTTLSVDETYLYVAYNTIDPRNLSNQQVVLERRYKTSLELVNRLIVLPQYSTSISTYALMGDISVSDNYLYISFTDDANGNGSYYVQKRLKKDFSLVSEYKSKNIHRSVVANGLAYKPKKKLFYNEIGNNGTYLQLRYQESDLDNLMKLYNNSYYLEKQEVRQ